MKKVIKKVVNQIPYVSSLSRQVDELSEQVARSGAFPLGHYYSPVPSKEEIAFSFREQELDTIEKLVGIDLNTNFQKELLGDFSKFYSDIPFKDNKSKDLRFYYNQVWFGHSDAIFLSCFLRKFKPRRIIEVGSGYSTAVILDTLDLFLDEDVRITCIEPEPDRLFSVLKEEDRNRVNIIKSKIQDVDLGIFSSLQEGDLLFIDSSHVVKFGSDLQRIFFDIIPNLPQGVFVHFHDVFYPFEYPKSWLEDGRYWNEDYFLRAFLSFNSSWEISFFNHYANLAFKDFISKNMPICQKNTGGSIYIKRVG